jgi:YVTN family beta-propeller protein
MRTCVALLLLAGPALAVDPPAKAPVQADPATRPGPTKDGFLLPNGWHLTPAGKHIATTDLPLNIVPLKDSRYALVGTCGFNPHHLSLLDLAEGKVVARETVIQSWFGMAVSGDEKKVWWAGGGNGLVHTFDLTDKKLKRLGEAEVDPAGERKAKGERGERTVGFKSGMCLSADGKTLYSLDIEAATLTAVAADGTAGKPAPVGKRPYDVVLSRNGALLFVSDWAGRVVLALDPKDLTVVSKIPVGEHPNQLVLHPKDDRLFVACASSNCVSVIDTKRGTVIETIYTALFPKSPEGSTPDAVAISPDGGTLYVANADNNCVCVIDVRVPSKSAVVGFIPTGWYPTAVAVTPDGKALLVGVGKGLVTKANPIPADPSKIEPTRGATESRKIINWPFIGQTLEGAVSVVPVPDEKKLREYTAQVYANCPYSDAQLTAAPHPEKTAIPTKVGDPSPIKHVIYVIKENRTYDQVFGDLADPKLGDKAKGKGDPALCMFPRKVTPNHHKLAEEFVLLDNLYCNGQVSTDGHPWSTGAYGTDYISRNWHLTYSARKGVADTDEGELAKPPSGYIWDACKRAGVSYRSYGEYGSRVSDGMGGFKMEGRVPGLIGKMCPDYGISRVPGAKNRDTDKAEVFIKELKQFEKDGTMPRFIVMSLGEDHTTGTTPGTFTPRACVASNDLALGRIVEAVSNSKFWPETAIFVIEDDAQNGPDHVDASRTVGLVVSPYTKRGHVDSTQYATVSMIRTMELILGLPPLSQYDASARPMFNSFTAKPDLTAYKHAPAEIDLDAKNDKNAFGAERSAKMDFSEYDNVDDFQLNEILWFAVMGRDAPQPPAVRRAIAFRPLAPTGPQPPRR